jgi:hypothetical protein
MSLIYRWVDPNRCIAASGPHSYACHHPRHASAHPALLATIKVCFSSSSNDFYIDSDAWSSPKAACPLSCTLVLREVELGTTTAMTRPPYMATVDVQWTTTNRMSDIGWTTDNLGDLWFERVLEKHTIVRTKYWLLIAMLAVNQQSLIFSPRIIRFFLLYAFLFI